MLEEILISCTPPKEEFASRPSVSMVLDPTFLWLIFDRQPRYRNPDVKSRHARTVDDLRSDKAQTRTLYHIPNGQKVDD